jgi:glycosyltransferase A (GT-A) superfamily protein (DUF2064 family)
VLAQTLERAGELGLRVAQLAPLDDLDSPADLVRWLAKAVSQGTRSSPRTSAALRAFGLHPHAA